MATFNQVTRNTFTGAYMVARAVNPNIKKACSGVDELPSEATFFLTCNGTAGYVIKDGGELCFVWSIVRGLGDEIIANAVFDGATHLDCFDGYLPSLYARHGFVEYKREPNWTEGQPDVVFMRLD